MTRRNSHRRPTRTRRSPRRLRTESLEPKLLLSADFGGQFSDHTGPDVTDGYRKDWDSFEPIANPWVRDAVSVASLEYRAEYVDISPGRIVAAVDLPVEPSLATIFVETIAWDARLETENVQVDGIHAAHEAGPGRTLALVELAFDPSHQVFDAIRSLEGDGFVLWSSPDFQYDDVDSRELTPDDPRFDDQHHHGLMQSELAWDTTLGSSSVVIGITDDGIESNHPDLQNRIWTNVGEIAGNGVDDDGNGYVDDIHGWNFVDTDNDIAPASPAPAHGTHVAGIAAAETNNAVGVSGVAGGATILPLRFYDASRPALFTSSIVSEAFSYGTDNGAQIISTSYNIDQFVGDPVFAAGLQYSYDQGVLLVNSAGNTSTANPARQVFEQTLLVANTNQSDERNSTSNYGTGIDIAAPGTAILSTIPGLGYGLSTGTSMAAPQVAGVAALIWSANPSWTREMVVSQLLATADNIDAANPNYVGLLGSGRVNAGRALTGSIAAPQVSSVLGVPADGGFTTSSTIESFDLKFDQFLDPSGVNNSESYELRNAGQDGLFDTADDGYAVLSASGYQTGSNHVTVDILNGPLGVGEYRLSILDGSLSNPFGSTLDGNGNGAAGGAFTTHFSIQNAPLVMRGTPGGLVYQSTFPGYIGGSAETDELSVSIDEGFSFGIRVKGQAGFVPRLTVEDPLGAVVVDLSSGSNELAAYDQTSIGGIYTISLNGLSESTGSYELELVLNAVPESEFPGAHLNDQLMDAEDISVSSLELGAVANDRLAVVGELAAADHDWFSFTLEDGQRASLVANAGAGVPSLELYDEAGLLLASGTATEVDTAILEFMDSTGEGSAETYYVHLSGEVGEYALIVTRGWTFDREPNNDSPGQPLLPGGVLGFVSSSDAAFMEPDDFPATVLNESVAGVTLSNNLGGDVYSVAATFGAPTGSYVFGPSASSPNGWSDDTNEFRADFAEPTNYVSIDVGSDDSSDVAFLRAYNSDGQLLEEVISSALSSGQSETLTISRNLADIAYIISAGLGVDITPLDRLVFGQPGGQDRYGLSVVAGDNIEITAELPGSGPFEFDNGLFVNEVSSLIVELVDPSGVVVASGENIRHTAVDSGDYSLHVSSSDGVGEYFIDVGGATGHLTPPVVLATSIAEGVTLSVFPTNVTVDFDETISQLSVDGSELLVNGIPSIGATFDDDDSITFQLDQAANRGAGDYTISLAADSLLDVEGAGNLEFASNFTIDNVSNPFANHGIPGGLVSASLDNLGNLVAGEVVEISFPTETDETVIARLTPDDPAAVVSLQLVGNTAHTAVAPGESVWLPLTDIASDVVIVQLSSDVSTGFDLDVFRNVDWHDASMTQSLLATEIVVNGGDARRMAMQGELNGAISLPVIHESKLPLQIGDGPIDIVLDGLTLPLSSTTLELIGPDDLIAATANSGTAGIDYSILGFVAQQAGEYTVRMTSEDQAEYQLLVTQGALFDTEPNGLGDPLRAFDRNANDHGALGFLDGDTDAYTIDLMAGATIQIVTETPFDDGNYAPLNGLDPRLELLGPDDSVVASDLGSVDGKNASISYVVAVDGTYTIHALPESGAGTYALSVSVTIQPDGDFNDDGFWNCHDIDSLVAAIVGGGAASEFDLTLDGLVDTNDRDAWLLEAGQVNGVPAGYSLGDANLDGIVDTLDFDIWVQNRFTVSPQWCSGDFTADGVVDLADFHIWNANKSIPMPVSQPIGESSQFVPRPPEKDAVFASIAGGNEVVWRPLSRDITRNRWIDLEDDEPVKPVGGVNDAVRAGDESDGLITFPA